LPASHERILVVDDSPAQRRCVADCLARQGFELDGARDMAQMGEADAPAYLVKPFSQDRCIALVERTLAERRLITYKEASALFISGAPAPPPRMIAPRAARHSRCAPTSARSASCSPTSSGSRRCRPPGRQPT
jgi:DNA-binding response OmpR family regulator